MRKLLLASAAMLGGTMAMATVASAQVATTYQNLTGNGPMPRECACRSGANSVAWLRHGGAELSAHRWSPGNVSVRIVGRMYAYFGVVSDSGRNAQHVTRRRQRRRRPRPPTRSWPATGCSSSPVCIRASTRLRRTG